MKDNAPLIILTAQRARVYSKFPPFGILFLAGSLLDAGFRVRIVHPERDRQAAIRDAVRQARPLFVGLSVMQSRLLLEDIEISRELKAAGVPVVWGGVYPSMMPELALASGYVDYVLTGEAESTVVEFADALARGASPRGIAGVGLRDDGGIDLTPCAPFAKDLDAFRPAWELIKPKDYVELYSGGQDLVFKIPLSRGCPFPCSFCYNRAQPDRRRFRIHGVDWIKRQIEYIKGKFDFTMVHWIGDNSFGKIEQGREAIEAAGMPWISPARIDIVDHDFAQWLVATRCRYIGFGMESGSDRVLEILEKGFTVGQIIKGMEILAGLDIITLLSWMHLIPGETGDDRRATRELMDELHRMCPNVIHAGIHPLKPWPGTPIWDRCIEMGMRPPATNEEWVDLHDSIPSLFGWSKKRVKRMMAMNQLLYGRTRMAEPLVPTWLYNLCRRRFLRGRFGGPIEEILRSRPALRDCMTVN